MYFASTSKSSIFNFKHTVSLENQLYGNLFKGTYLLIVCCSYLWFYYQLQKDPSKKIPGADMPKRGLFTQLHCPCSQMGSS